jgi:predicted PurR-regulated permease PerM
LPDRRFTRGFAPAAQAVAVAALGVVVVWTMYLARDVLLLIYVSVLLAIGFGPIVHAIEHQQVVPVGKRVPRWLAILAVYILIVGTVITVGFLVIPPLVTQARALGTALPDLIDRGQTLLIRYGLLDHRITLEEVIRRAPSSGDAVGTVAMAATGFVSGLFALLTVLILTFYLLIESDTLFRGFARLFPRADRPRVREAAEEISVKVSAWLSGQLFLGAVIGVSAAIGFYALGVPYFYVLALVAAFGEMVPVVGPVLSAIPAVVVGFTVSPKTGLFVLIFVLAQQQVENHFLVPKIMSRQVGVSAVTVIIALLIGGSVLGILGAILAVPTAAILQVVIEELLDERDRLEERASRAK